MITKIIDEALIQAAKERILDAENVVITTHVSPDGDAIGSSLAICHFLRQLGKGAVVIVPNEMPGFLKWLPAADEILVYNDQTKISKELIANADLILALDFNTLSRIDAMGIDVADAKAQKVMIDHHTNPGNFADVIISYPNISSTSEMIFRLICRMGYAPEIEKKIATCVYTGMMTDTGAFTYNSNSPEIYSIISELLKKEIDKDYIYRRINSNFSVSRLKLEGYALSEKMVVDEKMGVSVMSLTNEELTRFNYQKGDSEGFVNIPLSIKGVVLSAFFKEEDGKIKISLRSRGDVRANDIAAELFDGGGHVNAAGASTTEMTLDEAIKKFNDALPNYKAMIEQELSKEEYK